MVFRFKAGPLFDRLWCSIYTFIYLTLINLKSSRELACMKPWHVKGSIPRFSAWKLLYFVNLRIGGVTHAYGNLSLFGSVDLFHLTFVTSHNWTLMCNSIKGIINFKCQVCRGILCCHRIIFVSPYKLRGSCQKWPSLSSRRHFRVT